MTPNVVKGAGLSVGVSEYKDAKLTPCQAAAPGAREVADALDSKLVRGVRVLANPATNDTLFGELQKAARDAKGGSFFFYFAGHAMRRGDDLLLAVCDSELEGARGCVPLSDMLAILRSTPVARGLVILNIDLPADPKAKSPRFDDGITILGSTRVHEPASANVRLKEYSDALLKALRRPALEMEPYLEEGRLDGAGLARSIEAGAPKTAKPEVFATGAEPFVLRDLASELVAAKAAAAEKAAAQKAAAEKAAAQKVAAEKAAAEKAAAGKVAAEKAAAEKAAAEKAAAEKKAAVEKAVVEKAAVEKAAVEKAAVEKAAAEGATAAKTAVEEASEEEAAEEAAAERVGEDKKAPAVAANAEDAVEKKAPAREPEEKIAARKPKVAERSLEARKPEGALEKAPRRDRAMYVLAAAIVLAVIVYYLMNR